MAKVSRNQKHSISSYQLNERIAYLRKRRDMTQSALAKSSGLSQSTIAQIESGLKDPSVKTLEKIAIALDVVIPILFASDDILVFDMKKLKNKYKKVDDLNSTVEQAIGRVVRYAKEIGYSS